MTVQVATDLWQMGAAELAGAIRSRRASSGEVVEAHLRRIEAVNPAVNAIVTVLAEQARDAAAAADRAVARGDAVGPLHGVPFTVKANMDLVGTPTTMGLRALADACPTVDAPAVARLKAAGAIPLGQTNCPSITLRWHTDSELWGPTINPWDRRRTPGASSGGEAVALATGMSPLGLGSDGLGSLRWPAQCCGVAALKPTLGRVPNASSLEPADPAIGVQLTTVAGPMARRIADLRVALEQIAGATWRDPWTVPAPLCGPELPRPVRVSLVVDPCGVGTARQVRDGVRRAAAVLADAGYAIDEIEPPSIDAAAGALLTMLNTPDVRALWQRSRPMIPDDIQRFLVDFYEVAGDPDPLTAMGSFAVRQSLLRAWGEFQEDHPLVVAPVYTDIPFDAGSDLDDGRVAETIRGMRMTLAVSALGLPAVAVPVGVADGLPQVVQIVGPRYREDLCLDAAEAIEDRVGVLTPIDPR
jgi:amidase